ncbi:MAG: fibronectin type III domain-containing protein [Cyclobacteriaceae bacterium]
MKAIKMFLLSVCTLVIVSITSCETDDPAPVILDPITNFTITEGIKSVSLTWDKPEGDVMSYIISYVPENKSVVLENPDSTSLVISNLVAGTEYSFSIVWLNNSAKSSPEVTLSATPNAAPKLTFEGDLTVTSQAEIDAITELYTDVTGNLTIGGSEATDIKDLSKLGSIREVYQNMIVSSNAILTSFSDLKDLESVEGDITINDNSILVDFCNLSVALAEFDGQFTVTGNAYNPTVDQILDGACKSPDNIFIGDLVLETQADVDAIKTKYTKITGRLKIGNYANGDITDLSILNNVRTVDYLEVDGNSLLEDLSGLESLDSIITGNLTLRENLKIKSLKGLSSLTYLRNDIAFWNNAKLASLEGLENMTFVDEIFIGYTAGAEERPNPRLTDYCGLTNLVSLNLAKIQGNRSVINANAYNPTFEEIASGTCATDPIEDNVLEGGLRVNTQAEVDALPQYTKITGELVVGLDAATNDITDLSKFSKLSEIGGRLIIQRSPMITDLTGFSALTAIGTESVQELVVRQMDALTTLDGLQALKSVSRRIGIRENPILETLEGLNNIETIGENTITIGASCSSTEADLPKLTDFCALSGLVSRIGVSTLESGGSCINTNNALNPSFQDILDGNCAASGELVLEGGLRVNTQAEVDALPAYTKISGELVIGLDAATNDINDLSKFSRLTEIGGRLIIQRSPQITDLTGFSALQAIGTGSVQELVVRQMDGLTTLNGLQALKSVSRRIGIRENPELTTLEGLNNIETIGENTITIGTSCDATDASLPKLNDLCALSGLINQIGVATLEAGGSCINTNNSFNPSFQNILDGNCSQ